jgi:N-acetylglucosamine malate deacetylase 1
MKNKQAAVLIVLAHPDDVALGCAGMLFSLCSQKTLIAHLTLTCGERAGDGRQGEIDRIYQRYFPEEIRQGRLRLISGDLEDGRIPATGEPVERLESLVKRNCSGWEFDLAILHWPNDAHLDHINSARIGHRLARHIPSVLYFESWSSMQFLGNLCLDISRFWPARMEMIDMLKLHPQPEAKPRILGRAMYHGGVIHTMYAEAFATPGISIDTLGRYFSASLPEESN